MLGASARSVGGACRVRSAALVGARIRARTVGEANVKDSHGADGPERRTEASSLHPTLHLPTNPLLERPHDSAPDEPGRPSYTGEMSPHRKSQQIANPLRRNV